MDVHESLPKCPVFRRFAWWSMWQDVTMFTFAGACYLLQCSRNRNGKAKFRSVALGSSCYIFQGDYKKRGQ